MASVTTIMEENHAAKRHVTVKCFALGEAHSSNDFTFFTLEASHLLIFWLHLFVKNTYFLFFNI